MKAPTITPRGLSAAAGLAAVVGGALFIVVQVNHPHLDAGFATTSEYQVRESAKVLMAALSLVGITGIYLRQIRQTGLLGLIGYLVFGAGYLLIMATEITGAYLIPSLTHAAPGYVNDVLSAAVGQQTTGDIGGMRTLFQVTGIAYLGGGLVFGIALFRARILPRWAAALLAAGTFSTLAIHLVPQINERLFALPTGLAMIGLGYALWRGQPTADTLATPNLAASPIDLVDAR
jgi:hypothetical protein